MMIKRAFIYFLFVFLVACQGKDETDSGSNPDPDDGSQQNSDQITVSAGSDISVEEGAGVDLLGSASHSEGAAMTYKWKQLEGPEVKIYNSNKLIAYIDAPGVSVEEEFVDLVFELTASASSSNSSSDTVTINVVAVDDIPVVSVGEDFEVNEADVVELTASVTGEKNPLAEMRWEQVSGIDIDIEDADSLEASFVAPNITVLQGQQEVVLSFTAVDEDGNTESDELKIKINAINSAPTVFAGDDIDVDEGASVSLVGEAEDEYGAITGVVWEQIAGESVELNVISPLNVTFVAPDISAADGPSTLRFRMTATDDDGNQARDSVDVVVTPIDIKPTVDAGPDQDADEQDVVKLFGEASDANGTIESIKWTQEFGPEVELSSTDELETSFTVPNLSVLDGEQEFIFKLTVTDNDENDVSDTVTITVIPTNESPIVSAGDDQEVKVKDTVTLQGTAADEDGEIESIQWTQTDGPLVTLEDGNQLTTTFKAPNLSNDTVLVFVLTVTDNDGVEASDSVTVEVKANQLNVNDTGMLTCGDFNETNGGTTNSLTCGSITDTSSDIIKGQDGHYGNDVTNNDSSDGPAGFSFTKLDNQGLELPFGASDWRCVKDNVTGLIWEVKSQSGLQNSSHTYTWFDGNVGQENFGSCDGIDKCNTKAYVDKMNELKVCGSSDWRLPSIYEMQSISNYGSVNQPSVYAPIFKNYPLKDEVFWWTSSRSAVYWEVAHVISTHNANDPTTSMNVWVSSMSQTYHVRLVH